MCTPSPGSSEADSIYDSCISGHSSSFHSVLSLGMDLSPPRQALQSSSHGAQRHPAQAPADSSAAGGTDAHEDTGSPSEDITSSHVAGSQSPLERATSIPRSVKTSPADAHSCGGSTTASGSDTPTATSTAETSPVSEGTAPTPPTPPQRIQFGTLDAALQPLLAPPAKVALRALRSFPSGPVELPRPGSAPTAELALPLPLALPEAGAARSESSLKANGAATADAQLQGLVAEDSTAAQPEPDPAGHDDLHIAPTTADTEPETQDLDQEQEEHPHARPRHTAMQHMPSSEPEPPASAFSAVQDADEGTTAFRCADCDIYTTSPELLNAHLNGRKHQKRLANAPRAEDGSLPREGSYCEVCDVATTSEEQLALHKQGKRHHRHLEQASGAVHGSGELGSEGGGLQPLTPCENGDAAPGELKCELCDVTVPDANLAASHLRGQKHARRTKQEALLQDRDRIVNDTLDDLLDDAALDADSPTHAESRREASDEPPEPAEGNDQLPAGAAALPQAPQTPPPSKAVRFGSLDTAELGLGPERLPPASPFPALAKLDTKAEASSREASTAASTSSSHATSAPASPKPPPPLWRGASGMPGGAPPLHGGGSISLAAAHFCPVCGIIATSAANLQDHMRGRRHARRLQYLKHMPEADRAKQIDRIASGELLLRHGSNAGNSLDTSIAARLGSLTLPSSMDIARYLEQVQFVDLPEASPRKGLRNRLSQRLSTSSVMRELPIPEEGTLEGQEGSPESRKPAQGEGEAAAGASPPKQPLDASSEDSLEAETEHALLEGHAGPKEVHHCPVCSISTTSAAHLEAHLAGRKHRRRAEVAEGRVARRSPHVCRLCDISTTSADHMALHIAGRAHQRRLRAEANGEANGAVGGGMHADSQGSWDGPEEGLSASTAAAPSARTASRTASEQSLPRPSWHAQPPPHQDLPRESHGPHWGTWRSPRPPGPPGPWMPDGRRPNYQPRGPASSPPRHPPHPINRSPPTGASPPHTAQTFPTPPPPSPPHPPRGSPAPSTRLMSHAGLPGGLGPGHMQPPFVSFFPPPPFYPSPGVMAQPAFVSPGWWPATQEVSQPHPPSKPIVQNGMLPPLLLPGPIPPMAPPRPPGGYGEAPPGAGRIPPGDSEGQPSAYNCNTCQVQVNGIDKLRTHMRSRQHVRRAGASAQPPS